MLGRAGVRRRQFAVEQARENQGHDESHTLRDHGVGLARGSHHRSLALFCFLNCFPAVLDDSAIEAQGDAPSRYRRPRRFTGARIQQTSNSRTPCADLGRGLRGGRIRLARDLREHRESPKTRKAFGRSPCRVFVILKDLPLNNGKTIGRLTATI